jgi:preprotein translocase subunit SecE
MKFFQFFVEVKNELFKVVWPSRKETLKYTITVIVFSIAVALILGAADYGLLRLFEKLIQK